jgi:hypothetical protein
MPRVFPLALVAALAPSLMSGCAAATTSSGKFQGDQKAVAKVVDDLAQAGRRKDPQKICTELLAASLVARLKAGGTDCVGEMTKAIDDTDDFDLDVRSVDVRGTQASAVVRQGSKGPTATFTFAKEGGGWRATGLGGG